MGKALITPHAFEFMEVVMYRYCVALAILSVVRLFFAISLASAQFAPSADEMPTGDVWPSREERIYIPKSALVPNGVDHEANAASSSDAATPKSKITPSQHLSNIAVCLPHTDTLSGKNCAPQHIFPADAAEICESLPHKRSRAYRPADARYRNGHPGPDSPAYHSCSCARTRGWH